MNWITAVATTNQWVIIWLAIGFIAFIVLYILDIIFDDPTRHGAGRGNPIPVLVVTGIGILFLVMLTMGVGYVMDWIIWMWNN